MPKLKDDRHKRLQKQNAYAQAMLHSALSLGGIDEALRIRAELYEIVKAALTNFGVADLFREQIEEYYKETSKSIDIKKFVESVFKQASKVVIDVLTVMAQNKDMYLLLSLYDTYNLLFEDELGIVIVDITTVVKLNDNLREQIEKKLQNDFDKKIVLHEHISKDILGGIIINAKNRIIDCSMITVLENARTQLVAVHDYN